MRAHQKIQILAIALWGILCGFSTMAQAGFAIGEQCSNTSELPTSQCNSGECEGSDIKMEHNAFCVCDKDSQCSDEATKLGLTIEPGETWECVDGEAASFDLDFCQSNKGKKIYPVSKEKSEELIKKEAEAKAAAAAPAAPTAPPVAPVNYQATPPKMSVPIPGLAPFESTEVTTGEMVSIPWLAQYIVAVYKYAIIIGAIIAVLALMVGGVQYLIGGAYAEAASGAKKIMLGAVGGLVLLLASNLILQMINPQLTRLGGIDLQSVVPIDYNVIADKEAEGGYITGGSSGSCAAPKNSVLAYCGVTTNSAPHPNKEALIQKFKNFAACGNFNYNILMGICEHESSFRPGLTNCCCFKGLFQFKNDTWTASMNGWPGGKDTAYYLSQISLSTSPLSKTDPRLYNDDLQTMGITGATMLAKAKIFARCKGDVSHLSDGDIATLLYLYHNSGTGSLGNVLANGGCNGGNNIEQAFIKSWVDIITTRCKERAFGKGKSVCTPGDGGYGGPYNSIEEAKAGAQKFGEGKARSVRKAGESRIIGTYKATNLFKAVPGAGTCPIKTK
ncbi:hypothetical protein A2482_01660 [Candidatus Falkowbacteria bacterium RIFOXYC2_FULL_48_21]|uniref:Transglycosylase SLT domain-containing protein n=1 Tax=Candidatus Falkowbacteria bacterium RIFOXYC2_FULL_48_21 TaxID=1798005 RepID=A0A1F5TGF6_9BACT|nr:MAG: hypothetical protein A2482_01660 [Candidatus Falkowbacteria bacterium RIFOXYC2_FULL_48_21]